VCASGGWLALLVAVVLCAPLAAAAGQAQGAASKGAVVVYRKVFKASSPEFTEIRVPENGPGTCDLRALDEDPNPAEVEINSTLRQRIFTLAGELHEFRDISLDIKRRIANLGEKTFRYEKNGESSEVKFNYTLNAKANQLMQIFEALAQEQQDIEVLARRMKYDRLGVNEALIQVENDVKQKAVAQPERFLPLLEQIGADTHFLDIARERARALADTIRSGAH